MACDGMLTPFSPWFSAVTLLNPPTRTQTVTQGSGLYTTAAAVRERQARNKSTYFIIVSLSVLLLSDQALRINLDRIVWPNLVPKHLSGIIPQNLHDLAHNI